MFGWNEETKVECKFIFDMMYCNTVNEFCHLIINLLSLFH